MHASPIIAAIIAFCVSPVIADKAVTMELRFIDIPAQDLLKMQNHETLDKLIKESSGTKTAGIILTSTAGKPATASGTIGWIYGEVFHPPQLPNSIGGKIFPGGLPITTVSIPALDTRNIGTAISTKAWGEKKISTHLTDCIGLRNLALTKGDLILTPRFFTRGFEGTCTLPHHWTVVASNEHPRDPTQVTLTCIRSVWKEGR